MGLVLRALGVALLTATVLLPIADHHTAKDVRRLRAHVDELESLAGTDDFAAFLEQLAQFNYLILDLTGNGTIAVLGRLLSDIVTLHITAMAREWSAKPAKIAVFVDAALSGCRHLVELIQDSAAEEAEAFWLSQLETADRLDVFPQRHSRVPIAVQVDDDVDHLGH